MGKHHERKGLFSEAVAAMPEKMRQNIFEEITDGLPSDFQLFGLKTSPTSLRPLSSELDPTLPPLTKEDLLAEGVPTGPTMLSGPRPLAENFEVQRILEGEA